jgi:hypothetical protein
MAGIEGSMSYLNPPRLHFAGKFQASPSTVNNDPLHFNNATFKIPEYWEQTNDTTGGWFNPAGDAAWRLVGCKVTAAWVDHEQQAAVNDPIQNCLIGDSDRSPPAKIVDLDPEQQLVSQVWGMQVRIALTDGTNLLRRATRRPRSPTFGIALPMLVTISAPEQCFSRF